MHRVVGRVKQNPCFTSEHGAGTPALGRWLGEWASVTMWVAEISPDSRPCTCRERAPTKMSRQLDKSPMSDASRYIFVRRFMKFDQEVDWLLLDEPQNVLRVSIGKVAAHVHRHLHQRHLKSWERRDIYGDASPSYYNIIPIGCVSYDTSIASAPQASCVAQKFWCAIQELFPSRPGPLRMVILKHTRLTL